MADIVDLGSVETSSGTRVMGGATGGTAATTYYTMTGYDSGTWVTWNVTTTPDFTGALSGIIPPPTDISVISQYTV